VTGSDTCRFGHVFEVYDHDGNGAPNGEVRKKIEKGEISSFSELEQHTGTDRLASVMGDTYKKLKVSANSQGTPYTVAWACADKLDEEVGYNTEKSVEDIFVSPQSNLHDEFVQRKQQAEQRLNQTLGNLSERRQQKHLLEHDIRKLRSRVEAMNSRDETQIKADFVELVDGAGGGAQQGSDEAPLKTLRDQNIYPSIVADFFEMEGIDDLKTAEQKDAEDAEDGKLASLPASEKAILRKKWVMYEKWKDLYGSEIQRKLQDLKGQLKNVERSIQEVEDWIEPYARDVAMINQTSEDQLADMMSFYPTLRGSANMRRDLEFVLWKPLKNEGEAMRVVEDDEEATHFRIIVIMAVHVNLASGEQPNVPGGPSSATIEYYPGIVCRHVFERIFMEKIEKQKNRFRDMVEDYAGDLESEMGQKLRDAREDAGLSVRELREAVGEELGEQPPLEISSIIRRVEDGIDQPERISEEFGEQYLEAMESVLEMSFDESGDEEEMLSGAEKKIMKFMGQTDEYVIPDRADPLYDLLMEIKFDYYYGFKLGLGLYTMK
jgi:hypothetical protein